MDIESAIDNCFATQNKDGCVNSKMRSAFLNCTYHNLILYKMDLIYKKIIQKFIKEEIKEKLINSTYPRWEFKGTCEVDFGEIIKLFKSDNIDIITVNIKNMIMDNLPRYSKVKIKITQKDSYLFNYDINYKINLSTDIYNDTNIIHMMKLVDYNSFHSPIIENEIGNTKLLLHTLDNIILPRMIKHIEDKITFYSRKYKTLHFSFVDNEYIFADIIRHVSTSFKYDRKHNLFYRIKSGDIDWILERLYHMTKEHFNEKGVNISYLVTHKDIHNIFGCFMNMLCGNKTFMKNNTLIKIVGD